MIDDDKLTQLIKDIKNAGPQVEKLHLQIIDHGDTTAHDTLAALARAANDLVEEIYQEDFMVEGRYGPNAA
jgi:hypothetical protein